MQMRQNRRQRLASPSAASAASYHGNRDGRRRARHKHSRPLTSLNACVQACSEMARATTKIKSPNQYPLGWFAAIVAAILGLVALALAGNIASPSLWPGNFMIDGYRPGTLYFGSAWP